MMVMQFRSDPETLAKRLAASSIPEPNSGCLLWLGALSKYGHGKIGIRIKSNQPRTITTHRLAYELVHGPIPDGIVVRHKCDVSCCLNVDHLELGTQADNLADMWKRGRARPGYTPCDARSNNKLNWEDVRLIRSSPLSAKALGRQLGVSDCLVGRVRNGLSWKEPKQ